MWIWCQEQTRASLQMKCRWQIPRLQQQQQMVFFSSSVLLALSSGMSVELNSTLSALFIFTFLFLVGNCNLNLECQFAATAVLGGLMKEFRGPQSVSVWLEIGKPTKKKHNQLQNSHHIRRNAHSSTC